MDKFSVIKADRAYYLAAAEAEVVECGEYPYISLQGEGAPKAEKLQERQQVLYKLAHGVRELCESQGQDFFVPALEAAWWLEGEEYTGEEMSKDKWRWKLLYRMPDFVNKNLVEKAKANIKEEEGLDAAAVKHEKIKLGKCAQIMHQGPYIEEGKSIKLLHSFIKEKGLKVNGHHHEIYLTNPTSTPPASMKTILRQAVS